MVQSHEPHAAFDLKARVLVEQMGKMVDDAAAAMTPTSSDIGELRGQVKNIAQGLDNLGRDVKAGLEGLTNYIRQTDEKTTSRLDSERNRVSIELEKIQQVQFNQVAAKGNNTWQLVAITVPALIGLAGAGFTFWSLAKAPVDDKFAVQSSAIVSVASDLKDFMKVEADIAKGFVPKAEIDEIEANLKLVSDRQYANAAQQSYDRGFNLATQSSNAQQIASLREDQRLLAQAVSSTSATKEELRALSERESVISQRLQTIFDKNFATSKFPCLDSGAGCGPVGTPGPTALPSGSSGANPGK